MPSLEAIEKYHGLSRIEEQFLNAICRKSLSLDDTDLKLILDSFGIKIHAKLFRKTDLKAQIKNINMDI